MIPLNRLKQAGLFHLNPDHIEWMEQHAAETLIRLTNGREYVVTDKVDEILDSIRRERAAIMAMSLRVVPSTLERPEGDLAGGSDD